jgi:hypothetical protein
MSIKSVAKKVWNSKAFETIVGTTFDAMAFIGECIIDTFNQGSIQTHCGSCGSYLAPDKSDEEKTYEYWNSLSPVDREYYFEHNETLQKYGELYFYNDKEQCAKSIARIAKMERRSFTNKYDRY